MGRRRGAVLWLQLVLKDAVALAVQPGTVLDVHANSKMVQQLCSMILERMEWHMDVIPLEVRAISGFILSATLRYTPDLGYKLVGGYLLLRLINPVILDPGSLPGILSTPSSQLSAQARKNLGVLANVMQHLSNGGSSFKDADPSLNAWLASSIPMVNRLFEIASRDPNTPLGLSPWERYRARSMGENGGKVAASVLTVEEAEWCMKVFNSSREAVLMRLHRFATMEFGPKANPRMSMLLKSTHLRLSKQEKAHDDRRSIKTDLQLTSVFFARVAEAIKQSEEDTPGPPPELLPSAWLSQLAKLKVVHKTVVKVQFWRQDPQTFLWHAYKTDKEGASPEETIDFSQVYSVYSRIDPTNPSAGPSIIDLHTADKTLVFSFVKDMTKIRTWMTVLSDWVTYLRPHVRARKERRPLQGYLKKQGNRGPALLRQFKLRWFQQINDRLYYFEDVMSNALGFIELRSLAWIDFPDERVDGKWMFQLRQRRPLSLAQAGGGGAAGSENGGLSATTVVSLVSSTSAALNLDPMSASQPMNALLYNAEQKKRMGNIFDNDDDADDDSGDEAGGGGMDSELDYPDSGASDEARTWVLACDTQEDYQYWREGLSHFCSRRPSDVQRRKSRLVQQQNRGGESSSSSVGDQAVSSQRREDVQKKEFSQYETAPPPHLEAIFDWITEWLSRSDDVDVGSCLFGPRAAKLRLMGDEELMSTPVEALSAEHRETFRRDTGVAAIISFLCDGIALDASTNPRHVGGALLYALSTPSIPLVPEHQVARLLLVSQITTDVSGKFFSLHAIICSLPWQHRAVLHALVKLIRSSGEERRQHSVMTRLVQVVFGVGQQSVEQVSQVWHLIVENWDHAFNEGFRYGEWKVDAHLGTMTLAAAPLSTMIATLSNPFMTEVDPLGVRALLTAHFYVTTPAAIVSALTEVYKVYGGGPRRPSTWRKDLAAKSGAWPELRLSAIIATMKQWCLMDNSSAFASLITVFVRDTFFLGITHVLLRDEIHVDFSLCSADMYPFEWEFLQFLGVWKMAVVVAAPVVPPPRVFVTGPEVSSPDSSPRDNLSPAGSPQHTGSPWGSPRALSPIGSPKLPSSPELPNKRFGARPSPIAVPPPPAATAAASSSEQLSPKAKMKPLPRLPSATAPPPNKWATPTGYRSPRLQASLQQAPPLEADERPASSEPARLRLGGIRKGSRSPRPAPSATADSQMRPEDHPLWKEAPLSIAAVLASLDAEYLREVAAEELKQGRWKQRETAPTFWAFRDRETWYQTWCLGWVLRYDGADDQAVVIVILLKLALQLRYIKDYMGSKAIVHALSQPCLVALKRTFALVPEDYQARLRSLQRFYGNAELYEKELEQRSLPIIPCPSDVMFALEKADALSNSVPARSPGNREWCNMTKLREFSAVANTVLRFRKSAIASVFETPYASLLELVKRHSPLVMDEKEALQIAKRLLITPPSDEFTLRKSNTTVEWEDE